MLDYMIRQEKRLHSLPHDECLLLKFSFPLPAAHLDFIGVQYTHKEWEDPDGDITGDMAFLIYI